MPTGYAIYVRTDAPTPTTPQDIAAIKEYITSRKGVLIGTPTPDSPPGCPVWWKILENPEIKVVITPRVEDLDPTNKVRGVIQRLLELKQRGKYLDVVESVAGPAARAVRTLGEWVDPAKNGPIWVDRAAIVIPTLDWAAKVYSEAWGRKTRLGLAAAKERGVQVGRHLFCRCGHPQTSKGVVIHLGGEGPCSLCGCQKYEAGIA